MLDSPTYSAFIGYHIQKYPDSRLIGERACISIENLSGFFIVVATGDSELNNVMRYSGSSLEGRTRRVGSEPYRSVLYLDNGCKTALVKVYTGGKDPLKNFQ